MRFDMHARDATLALQHEGIALEPHAVGKTRDIGTNRNEDAALR